MPQPIIYIDRSDIRSGKIEEVKAAIHELTDFVETHVPQLIAYSFSVDEDTGEMIVVAVHPDSASMEHHLDTGGPAFRKMGEFITLRSIEVFGEVSGKVLSQLHQKAEMLGEGTASVVPHHYHAGFSRVPATPR